MEVIGISEDIKQHDLTETVLPHLIACDTAMAATPTLC
jgi:hypothetical protein